MFGMFCSHFVLDLISKQIVLSDLNYSISFKFGSKTILISHQISIPLRIFFLCHFNTNSLQSNLTLLTPLIHATRHYNSLVGPNPHIFPKMSLLNTDNLLIFMLFKWTDWDKPRCSNNIFFLFLQATHLSHLVLTRPT